MVRAWTFWTGTTERATLQRVHFLWQQSDGGEQGGGANLCRGGRTPACRTAAAGQRSRPEVHRCRQQEETLVSWEGCQEER